MDQPVKWTKETAEAAFWEEVTEVHDERELDDVLGMYLYRLAMAMEAQTKWTN